MKINFILPFTGLTGGIKIAFEYCNRLKEKGHDVVIYVPMKAYKFNNSGIMGGLKTLKASLGNTIIRGSKVDWFDITVDIKLIPVIKTQFIRNADIVVATAWPTAYDVHSLDKSKGEKVYLIQGYEIWSGDEKCVDNSYKLPLSQIVISRGLQNIMKEKFNKSARLIHNGIDFEEFKYIEKYKKNADIHILMLYHTVECKGYEDGLKAFELVKQKYPNIRLTLFGTHKGNNIPEYAEFFENPSKVEINKLYNESDIFIFPSRLEGWGLTVIEAMSCKCAVVGTNTGALNEIGINEENALISDTNDIKALSENIIKLIENPSLRKQIGENGYLTSLNYNWSESVDKMEDLFITLKNKK